MNPEDYISESAAEALLQDVCKALRADMAAQRATLASVIAEASENKLRARSFQRDAERYRWLRDGNNDTEGLLPLVAGDDLDAAIDIAMDGGTAFG